MDQKGEELITNKTSLTTQPSGLASRGLQIANKLAERNSKPVKQFIDEKYFTNSIGLKFRLIPAGIFIMGSPETEEDRFDDEEQHEVTISKAFWMGVHEVTQGQYKTVMGINPSYFSNSQAHVSDISMHPVENVSWKDAVKFCKNLSGLPEERKAGRMYRLPTEAEWEYSCRGGGKTAYSFGDNGQDLGKYAWFCNNSCSKELDFDSLWSRLQGNSKEFSDTLFLAGCTTHPVCEKKPNDWGLYEMHGNVWEWCSDRYGDYPRGAVSDPCGPRNGSDRVARGGSFCFGAAMCRSAFRGKSKPSSRSCNIGFRVALNSSGIHMSPETDK